MKLIWCNECRDVVNLWPGEIRRCHCGRSGGMYITMNDAIIFGPCTPLGISNMSFHAVLNSPVGGVFAGFIYGYEVPDHGTVIRVEDPDERTDRADREESTAGQTGMGSEDPQAEL